MDYREVELYSKEVRF